MNNALWESLYVQYDRVDVGVNLYFIYLFIEYPLLDIYVTVCLDMFDNVCVNVCVFVDGCLDICVFVIVCMDVCVTSIFGIVSQSRISLQSNNIT